MTALVFGFAPGATLRLIVLVLPRSDPRRQKLIAELYVVRRWERSIWVAEQVEVCLFEGLEQRLKIRRDRRLSTRVGRYSTMKMIELGVTEFSHGWRTRFLVMAVKTFGLVTFFFMPIISVTLG
jgi:hypothetical protein